LPTGERELGLIDSAWASRLKARSWASLKKAQTGFFANYQEQVQRQPWGKLMTLKQASSIYSYSESITLTAEHHMHMNGWPSTINTSQIGAKDLKSMAGEGYSLPCATLALLAYYFNPEGDWWSQGRSKPHVAP
jgi:hypothetical protein